MNEFFDLLYLRQCRPYINMDEPYATFPKYVAFESTLSDAQKRAFLDIRDIIDRHADLRAHEAFAQGIRFTVSLAQTLYAEPDSYTYR